MKIYLIRHGESTSDVENRYGGDYDDYLTENGKAQARKLADELAGKGIEIIFLSPRHRAKETAQILKEKLKCELKFVDDIRERNNYGILTGMKKSEAKEKYPDQVELLKSTYNTVKDGESYEHFKGRIISSFNKIISSKYKTIAIVTHGGPIRCIFREILRLGEIKELKDCHVFELEKKREKLVLIRGEY